MGAKQSERQIGDFDGQLKFHLNVDVELVVRRRQGAGHFGIVPKDPWSWRESALAGNEE